MYCSACGKKCPDGAVYCAWCGTKLPELAAEQAESALAVEAAAEVAPALPGAGGPDGAEPPDRGADFDAPSEKSDEPEPKKPDENPHRAYQRPQPRYERADDAQTVRPLAANPAQPLRGAAATGGGAPNEPNEPEEFEAIDELEGAEPDLAPAPRSGARARGDLDGARARPGQSAQRDARPNGRKPFRFGWGAHSAVRAAQERGEDHSAKRSPYERGEDRPAKHLPYERGEDRSAKRLPYERGEDRPAKRSSYERGEDHSAKRSSYERGEDRPAARAALDPDERPRGKAQRPKRPDDRGKAVTASGGMVTPPARRPPARSGAFNPSKQPRNDLFFEDLEMPAENFYDEAAEERALARRIKAIVSIALVAGIAMVAAWLMWTPGGQIARAQLNLGAPASAYKALGDQNLAGGQVQRAADAYYSALRLDQENYEYAMLVGKTQEMIGDREVAAKAFTKCVLLKPTAVEPYARLRALYKEMGDDQMAESVRAEGYAKTGDATLAPGT